MSPHPPTKDERDFMRVVQISTALGLGVMVAFLYSIKQIHPHLRLEITFGTVAAFAVTAVLSWIFCGLLFREEFASGDDAARDAVFRQRRVRRWLVFFLVVAALLTGGAFLYSLKDVSAESRREVIEGTGIAVIVLSGGGFLIYKSVQFFEEQDRASLSHWEEEQGEDEDDKKDPD